jgi:hypothetical protein
MQRLIAVDTGQALIYRINHQIHCLKRQAWRLLLFSELLCPE